MLEHLVQAVGDIKEYRTGQNIHHPLHAMMVIIFLAVACGETSMKGITRFVAESWREIGRILGLKSPPCRTTLRKAINLSGIVFGNDIRGRHVRIDGKILRGTRVGGQQVLLVEAWDGERLIGFESDSPGNEKAAARRVIEALDLAGKVVTLDAGLSDNNILSAVVERGGSYVARVKRNKPLLCDSIEQAFVGVPFQATDTDLAHGRIEVRESTVVDDPETIERIRSVHRVPKLAAVGRTDRVRISKKTGKTEMDACWYVIGPTVPKEEYGRYVREHWEIEAMHCRADVTLNEDRCHSRTTETAVSLAVLRRLGMTVRRLLHPSQDHATALFKCRFNPFRTFERLFNGAKNPAFQPK
jgi:hypothetical protein